MRLTPHPIPRRNQVPRLAVWLVVLGALLVGTLGQRGLRAADEPPKAGEAAAGKEDGKSDGGEKKAGDDAEAAEATPGPTGVEKQAPENILEMIVAGGTLNIVFFIVLGLFSLVSAAVVMERMVNITQQKLIPQEIVRDLKELIRKGDVRAASYRELSQKSTSILANILKAGLHRIGRPLGEIEKSMEDAAAREVARIRGRIRPLSVVASVAPLVGLLGTVVGMLQAFRTASQAGLGKAELLAEGIYLALETTVAGLVIAIPCLLFAAWFNSRTERYMFEIDEQMMDALPMLARLEHDAPERPATRGTTNPLLAGR